MEQTASAGQQAWAAGREGGTSEGIDNGSGGCVDRPFMPLFVSPFFVIVLLIYLCIYI